MLRNGSKNGQPARGITQGLRCKVEQIRRRKMRDFERSHWKVSKVKKQCHKRGGIILGKGPRSHKGETIERGQTARGTNRVDSLVVFGRIRTHAQRVQRTVRKIRRIIRGILQDAERRAEKSEERARRRQEITRRDGIVHFGPHREDLRQGDVGGRREMTQMIDPSLHHIQYYENLLMI